MDGEYEHLQGMLNAAIRLGESRLDEMLSLAIELREIRRNIRKAVQLMQTGRASEALVLLQSLTQR
jgi:hypothetical protein